MKRILLVLVLSLSHNLAILGKLQHTQWEAIAKDIAKVGDADDRGEFEAAKQAFLNIALPANRNRAADEIAKTWQANFPEEAAKDKLLALTPYPKMDDKGILKASIELFTKPNIKKFLDNEKIAVDISGAEAALAA